MVYGGYDGPRGTGGLGGMRWLGFVVGMGVYLGLCTLAGHDVGWHGWWDPMCATTAPMEHGALLFVMIFFILVLEERK